MILPVNGLGVWSCQRGERYRSKVDLFVLETVLELEKTGTGVCLLRWIYKSVK
jgi:hypothetical protein